jgi:hypothetical protein
MGIRLIFLSQVSVTNGNVLLNLIGLIQLGFLFQEITLTLKTVPQTNTGGLVEYTKACERTMLKELGKLSS